ncbi:hypothetical protein D9M72_570140 [compost metagenome]
MFRRDCPWRDAGDLGRTIRPGDRKAILHRGLQQATERQAPQRHPGMAKLLQVLVVGPQKVLDVESRHQLGGQQGAEDIDGRAGFGAHLFGDAIDLLQAQPGAHGLGESL